MNNSNALAVREQNNQVATTRSQDIDIFRLGQAFAKSGYFADAKDEAQAVVKIIYGQEMGISPAASMSGIHIIKGKPVVGATALAGLIKSKRPLYDFRVLHLDAQSCDLEFFESGQSVGKSNFTIEKAKAAGIIESNANWKKYPENMLFSRAISNGARLYCPDILVGSPIYTPDELGGKVDSEGDFIHDAADESAKVLPMPVPPISGNKPGHVGIGYPQAAKNITPEKTPDAVAPKSNLFDDEKDIEQIRALLAESDEETLKDVARTREKIRLLLMSIEINPTTSLNRFDTLKTPADCAEALNKTRAFVSDTYRKNKINQIEFAVKSDGWGLTEEGTADFFAKKGISGELKTATDEQLNDVLGELVELGLL